MKTIESSADVVVSIDCKGVSDANNNYGGYSCKLVAKI